MNQLETTYLFTRGPTLGPWYIDLHISKPRLIPVSDPLFSLVETRLGIRTTEDRSLPKIGVMFVTSEVLPSLYVEGRRGGESVRLLQ